MRFGKRATAKSRYRIYKLKKSYFKILENSKSYKIISDFQRRRQDDPDTRLFRSYNYLGFERKGDKSVEVTRSVESLSVVDTVTSGLYKAYKMNIPNLIEFINTLDDKDHRVIGFGDVQPHLHPAKNARCASKS